MNRSIGAARPLRPLAASLLAGLLLASCASLAGARAPDWVLNPPAPDAKDTFFVGSASIAGKDLSRATDDATANLVASVMRYIGAKVTADSTATAKASLEGFETEIRQTVRTEATNRVAGFRIADRFSSADRESGRLTVWILAAYRTEDLEREKRRIEALFVERVDAVAKPEARGKAFLEEGRNWEALSSFVEAALAASRGGIDNASIKVERNLAQARTSIESLRFLVEAPQGQVLTGKAYPGPFRIRLVSGSGARGVEGASLLVSYPRKQGTRVGQKTVEAVTDSAGLLLFTPPPPDFAGKGRLSVRLDGAAQAALLDTLPPSWSSAADPLRSTLATISFDLDYTVLSPAREVALLIALVDLDEEGSLMPAMVASEAATESLVASGFDARRLAVDPLLVQAGDEPSLRATAALAAGEGTTRLVHGSARITGLRRDGSSWIAEARIQVRVMDLSNGVLVGVFEKTLAAVGGDEAAARRAALREVGGKGLGQELAATLP